MSLIRDVSDTALWVAVHRAREGARADALYHDPLSLKLAGLRGEAIAKKMAGGEFMSWMMSMRTVAIDHMIEIAIKNGVTRVVNLGAGLDTRPYRTKLPQSINWIEVDLPGIIQHKNEVLKSEKPLVDLRRVPVDLTDSSKRSRFFETLHESDQPTVVLTEGVLLYLDNENVVSLAGALRQIQSVRYWIHDYREGGYASGIPKFWIKWRMRNAEMKFIVENWFGFFENLGWRVKEKTTLKEESDRHHRPVGRPDWFGLMSFFIPPQRMEEYSRQLGIVMMEKRS